MISREDARWGLAVALSVVPLVAALPLLPVMWLAGRVEDWLDRNWAP